MTRDMSIAKKLRYTERNDSIPKRKSCTACAKAKRRCDLALPVCSRCSLRKLDCHYPLLMHGNTPSSIPTPPDLDSLDSLMTLPPTTLQQPECFHIYGVDDLMLMNMPTFPLLPPAAVSRIQFAFKQLQDAPRMMVLENQTAWCHPLLYGNKMPKSMQGNYHSMTMMSWSFFFPTACLGHS
jgi:hypothetical protein